MQAMSNNVAKDIEFGNPISYRSEDNGFEDYSLLHMAAQFDILDPQDYSKLQRDEIIQKELDRGCGRNIFLER